MKKKNKAYLSLRLDETYASQFDELKKIAIQRGYTLSKASLVQEALFSNKTLQSVIDEKKMMLNDGGTTVS